jgi:hypothetical protein
MEITNDQNHIYRARPEPGQLVEVRRHQWVVAEVSVHDGWHAKTDILASTDITDGQWNTAIADLIASDRVERQGERRGARYRFLTGEEK